MTIDLTSIANAVIALIAAIITAFVIPWIRSKTTAAQFEKIKMWVTVAVEAAEQLYTERHKLFGKGSKFRFGYIV
mgnify:CR=1 FL=1